MQYQFTITLTKPDILAYNLYHQKQYPSYQRSLRLNKWLLPAMLLLFIVVLFIGSAEMRLIRSMIVVSVIGTAIWFIVYNQVMDRRLSRIVGQMLDEGKIPFSPEPSTLSFTDETIIDESDEAKNEIQYTKIASLVSHQGYLYLYISPVSALVMADNVFENQKQKEQFMDFIAGKTGLEFEQG